MEKRVLDYIEKNNMLSYGDGVVVGVSGGADSMCLLNILISLKDKLNLKLVAVHVNHGIRGASADADEHFVEAFCVQKGIDFCAVHANVPLMAKEQGLTEEEAGRNLRYDSFEKACSEYGMNKIAVAHNSDDNAETVLFNIARGSGISGIRGISPVRKLGGFTVIRPVLCCSRSQIEEYLREKGIGYRTDETNLTDDYRRNVVRNRILPLFRDEINKGVSAHISELAEQAAEIEDLVNTMTGAEIERLEREKLLRYVFYAKGRPGRIEIDADQLTDMKRALRNAVIRHLTGRIAGRLKDIESVHIKAIESLIGASVGKKTDLPYGVTVRRSYKDLIFEKRPDDRHTVSGGEENDRNDRIADDLKTIDVDVDAAPVKYDLPGDRTIKLNIIPYEKNLNIPRNDYTNFFDYDKIKGNIVLRTRREGDYMLIKSNRGNPGELHRKTLKTALIDMKIPAELRDKLILLAEGEHVLWIIGYRRDDSCYVTGDTHTVLIAEIGQG